MNDLIIETKKLTKIYGNQKSVSELSLHVRRGRIYGLLGRKEEMYLFTNSKFKKCWKTLLKKQRT